MRKIFILYNPLAGFKGGKERAEALRSYYKDVELEFLDVTEMRDYHAFLSGLKSGDEVVVCGGDGTLNRFVNNIYGLDVANNIYYYATGIGNDFLRDVGHAPGDGPFLINGYIKDLPLVTVNGESFRFINGIGYGLDGYCCSEGDAQRERGKKPNYTKIAIKGLLYGFKPVNATVTVDGETKEYQYVWIAPTMFGRYYGGGMMPTPGQSRDDPERAVSAAVMHCKSKIKTLICFPSIFKGEHVKYTKLVDIAKGHSVKVRFDRPVSLQVDGETFLNVSEYEVTSGPQAG